MTHLGSPHAFAHGPRMTRRRHTTRFSLLWHRLTLPLIMQAICLFIALGTPRAAMAASEHHVDSFYQFYRSDPTYIEDYVRLDAPAALVGDTLQAQVNPFADSLTLRDADIEWRVMLNFSGGILAQERDISDEARYDALSGTLTIPACYAYECVSFVAQLPWMHPAHNLVSHWDRGACASMRTQTDGCPTVRPFLLPALSTASDIAAGTVYPIKNVASGTNGSYRPLMLGNDFGTSNLATLCGHPECEGRYCFFVAFQKDNCELFELVNAVPGPVGGAGDVSTASGSVTPHDLRDNHWVAADCVEDVNNGREIFYILEDAGSWVRVDSIEGSVLHCTFRLSVNGPNGVNYQDVMGKFDLELPYGSIAVCKRSSNPAITDGNARYSLDGATYGVYSDAACTQTVGTIVTDAAGQGLLENLVAGTYWVRELVAPTGYALDTATHSVVVGPAQTATVGDVGTTDAPLHATGNLTVRKLDAEGASEAQGDALLSGAVFEVAYYDGVYEHPEALPANATRTWSVTSIELDDGTVGICLGDIRCAPHGDELYDLSGTVVLPLGTVAVRELTAPTGYLLSDATTHLLQVVADEQAEGGASLRKVGEWDEAGLPGTDLDLAIKDRVARGGVRLGKVDAESGQHVAQGAATLEGAVLAVELTSQHPVIVGGTTHSPGEIVATVTLGPDGTGATSSDALPYGSYVAYEVTAPRGYLLREKSAWSRHFSIRAEGDVVDLADAENSVPNQVVRGDLDLTKVAELTMEHLGGVPFVVISNTTGEAHVIVTDGNGYASTAASWNAHTKATNANDRAATCQDGTWSIIDEQALRPDAGIWFSGYAGANEDADTDADDTLGALPYDTYTLTELRASSNAGMVPVSFTVTIDRHGTVVAGGTISNRPAPTIATTLTDATSGTHATAAGETVMLRDDVRYTSLDVGVTYDLVGILHLVGADGGDGGVLRDANDQPVTASTSFVANQPDGMASVTFTLDARLLEGRSVVAFETLRRDGELIAEHEDASDADQTVSFAGLATLLTDADEGSKLVATTGRTTVVDAISYHGLVPGTPYRLVGTLMDADTGLPASSGEGPITGSTTFVPNESSGLVDVRFDFDAARQAGHNLVAYQALYEGQTEIVIHADLDNKDQTVGMPAIATTATAQSTGTHETLATRDVIIVDTVSYTNLVPNETYELSAILVDADSGTTIAGSEQQPAARASFVATETQGSVDVVIPLDATTLAGTTVTVCEYLYHEGRLLARHAVLGDADQSIHFPRITTEATDASTGTHTAGADGRVNIVDSVFYQGLTPGSEYMVIGTLHRRTEDGNDGGTVRGGDGVDALTTVTFVPERSEGTVRVAFDIDATELAGQTVVAFEQVLHGGSGIVAEHADIASDAQAVAIATRTTGGSLPKTGDPQTSPLPLVLMGGATLLLGMVGMSLAHAPRNHARRRTVHTRRPWHVRAQGAMSAGGVSRPRRTRAGMGDPRRHAGGTARLTSRRNGRAPNALRMPSIPHAPV